MKERSLTNTKNSATSADKEKPVKETAVKSLFRNVPRESMTKKSTSTGV